MRAIGELLADVPVLAGFKTEHRDVLARCASTRAFAPGDEILREGEPADRFYVLRRGSVAVEVLVPGRGPVTVQTLHDGDVLGWSWVVPPFRTAFGARAIETTHALAFDAGCVREACDADPSLGYDLLRLMAAVFTARLHDARLRLLDVYGNGRHG